MLDMTHMALEITRISPCMSVHISCTFVHIIVHILAPAVNRAVNRRARTVNRMVNRCGGTESEPESSEFRVLGNFAYQLTDRLTGGPDRLIDKSFWSCPESTTVLSVGEF